MSAREARELGGRLAALVQAGKARQAWLALLMPRRLLPIIPRPLGQLDAPMHVSSV